jgi:hypothetical protein
MLPTDCAFSVVSGSWGLNEAQYGFARCHDAPVEPANLEPIPGFGDGVFRFRVQRRIDVLQKLCGCRLRLNRRPVVDEMPNRNPAGELRHRAEVVTVPMRRDQVIDARHSRVVDRRHDPISIARGCGAAIARINQN